MSSRLPRLRSSVFLNDMAALVQEIELALDTLTKLVFSQPTDADIAAKITVRPILVKGNTVYQLERFQSNKAYHTNCSSELLLEQIRDELDGKYRQVLLVTQNETRQYTRKQNGSYKCTSRTASLPRPAAVGAQNRKKEYILEEGENIPALVDLGVFNEEFHIVKSKYDKYRQINRFIELIDHSLKDGSLPEEFTVLDFGCGKSYLTFILYYYLTIKRGLKAHIIGYDLKEDVVAHCNEIAQKYHYENLSFVVSDVTKDVLYHQHIDMIITLHACDTATDYALHYAITHGVRRVFSVPCCQHEVNAQIQPGGDLDLLLRYGIIKERVSALLTDAIRGLVMESQGYQVDMIEFIDFAHSPKNIMLRCEKRKNRNPKLFAQAQQLCTKYGFRQTLVSLTESGNPSD